MIKALLLVLDPAGTWDAIVQKRRGWPAILLFYVLPMLLLAFVAEFYGLVHWGKPRGFFGRVETLSHSKALIVELIRFVLVLLLVLLGSVLFTALGQSFHGRNTFPRAFTVPAYGLAPVFTLRFLDIFPGVSGWVYWATWGIGIFL